MILLIIALISGAAQLASGLPDLDTNTGNYSACPSYSSIMDVPSMQGFEEQSYQGEWYILAHNGNDRIKTQHTLGYILLT
jgi:hypothetical protein